MIDLNNIGNGKKLIKEVMKNSKLKNTPFSKQKQVEQLSKQKNAHNNQSRLSKK